LAFLLLFRAAFPLGFMPGDVAAGETLVVVCPDGLPAEFLADSHNHDHAGDDQQIAHPDGCPFALMLAQDAVIFGTSSMQATVPSEPGITEYPLILAADLRRLVKIRAPPVLVS